MIPKLDVYKNKWAIESENVIKPGLSAIRNALTKVGSPEKQLPIIHVAGTNGKGSTIAFMESILKEHGFSVGVFSSPAIFDIHDQIRINGQPITENELNRSFKIIKEAGLSGLLTDFELLTVAAFLIFERNSLDYVLLETGMGGRLDSTNVVTPLVSVITSIALDHTAFLGESIQQVAEHKAGIVKIGVPTVIGPLPLEALQVVREITTAKKSTLYTYGEQFVVENVPEEIFKGQKKYKLSNRKMKGKHQGVNASIAIEALLIANVPLTEEAVANGVSATQLAYRFQEIKPGVFLDGAHNPAAAKELAKTIQLEFPGEKVDFIMGMLKGKDIKGTIDELVPVASSFTFLSFTHPQAATGKELMEYCDHDRKRVTNSTNGTIILYRENDKKKIVTGSLYLLAGIIDY